MSENRTFNVAIVGATGAVGQKIIQILEQRQLPIRQLKLLSSARSAGKKINFKDQELIVEEATPKSFSNIDIALFSAGGSISKKLAPEAVKQGAIVIDNTSAYRMDPNVPLIVPEVNATAIKDHQGIIANPNCSTIQMLVALKPIQEAFGLSRIIVSTYQAVSGAGLNAVSELERQINQHVNDEEMTAEILPAGADKKHYPIAFNALPQIDLFDESGYTLEELKMMNETKKIMGEPDLQVAATCVRLPVFSSHSESIFVETEKEATVAEVQQLLSAGEGLVLEDDPSTQTYPTPLSAQDKKEVFVGRVRKDPHMDNGFHMWVVSDNLVKGAAWNTVQIAESLVKQNLV